MEMILSFVAGIVLAGIAAMIMLRSAKSSATAMQEKLLQDAAEKFEANLKATTAKLQADLVNAQQNLERAKENAEQHTQSLLTAKEEAHKAAFTAMEKKHEEAMSAMERRHAEAVESERARFNETMAKMTAEVKHTADDILKQQQAELKKTNKESVEQLMAPLNQQMKDMNQLMTDTRSANEKSAASLEGALKQMVQQTETVGKQADNLAEALKNKGKVHGDWGEQVLDDILAGSGLREGEEYTKQEVFPLGNGQSYRPDFIVNTPDGKRIIVDSKVSLTAYADALAAATQEEYEQCAKRNYDSVWAHVKELSDKDYAKHVKDSLGYVLMFMPNEGAYVMAMNYNRSLGQEAFRKGVVIVNPTNLMLVLHLVLQTWNGTRQEDNCKKILKVANDMHDKVVGIVDTCDTLVKQMKTASGTCETLHSQIKEGKGNLLGRVENMRSLGVTSTKRPKVASERQVEEIPTLEEQ